MDAELLDNDRRLVDELTAQGFTGADWHLVARELTGYASAVLSAWMTTGTLDRQLRHTSLNIVQTHDEIQRLRHDAGFRGAVIAAAVAAALPEFRISTLGGYGWSRHIGIYLTTYVLGACLFEIPDALDRHRASLPRHPSPQTPPDHNELPDGDRILLWGRMHGYSNTELAEYLGAIAPSAVQRRWADLADSVDWIGRLEVPRASDRRHDVSGVALLDGTSLSTPGARAVRGRTATRAATGNSPHKSPTEIGSAMRIDDQLTFDSFVVDASNRFAHAAALTAAEAPARAYNPIFIWGAAGLGKTHLLHAIANRARQRLPGIRIRLQRASALRSVDAEALRDGVDVILVDGVEDLVDPTARQAFARTVELLHRANRQVVMSGDRQPRELSLYPPVIESSEWGLIVDVTPPSPAAQMALRRRAAASHRPASRTTPLICTPPEPFGDHPSATAARHGSGVDGKRAALLRWGFDPASHLPPEAIIAATAAQFGIAADTLRGPTADRTLRAALRVACFLCMEVADASPVLIGRKLHLSRTAVMVAHRQIRHQIDSGSGPLGMIREIVSALGGVPDDGGAASL
ncbi:DnaA ATPase domain-containing protein [Mycobacterium sp. NPDC051198]